MVNSKKVAKKVVKKVAKKTTEDIKYELDIKYITANKINHNEFINFCLNGHINAVIAICAFCKDDFLITETFEKQLYKVIGERNSRFHSI